MKHQLIASSGTPYPSSCFSQTQTLSPKLDTPRGTTHPLARDAYQMSFVICIRYGYRGEALLMMHERSN